MRYVVRVEPTFFMTARGEIAQGYEREYRKRGCALNFAAREVRLWAYTGPRGQQESLATVSVVEVPA